MATKKDTIYIDIEDDITAIIDKVKASSSSLIALVPPKRAEVLQSAVNLKLLKRASQTSKKTIVLVTNQQSILTLAGGVGMYVAKDLHSKPSIPPAPNLSEDVGVIEGEAPLELDPNAPIGVLAGVAAPGDPTPVLAPDAKPSKSAKGPKPVKKKRSLKIPNFERFRTKVLLAGLALVVLAVGWWLAYFRLPTASVVVKAQTSRVPIEMPVTIQADVSSSNIEQSILKADQVEVAKTVTEEFSATGEKDIGNKASGTITVRNCDSSQAVTIPTGTGFSYANLTFISSRAVSVPGGSFSGGECDAAGVADVSVVAQEAGEDFNLPSGTQYSVADQGGLITGLGGQMTGGTTELVKVIDQSDIDGAIAKLQPPENSEVEKELSAQLEEGFQAVTESIQRTANTPSGSPSAGTQADKGTVTITYTYTMLGVSTDEISELLEAQLTEQIDESNQAIFSNGGDEATYSIEEIVSPTELKASLQANGFVGPKIDTEKLAQDLTGRRFSDLVDTVKAIPGVTEVEADFSPFWVFSAPRDPEKISIDLQVADRTIQ
jgi:hypothetical protein